MINNFELIKPLLKWVSDDDFYFLQILQRKKDHVKGKVNGTNNNSRLIKAYYVKSLEHLEFIMPEVIELCKLFNARAGINLNKRSFEKMALQHLKKVTDQIINKSFDKAHKAYNSVCGLYSNDSDKKWILDIDEPFDQGYMTELDDMLYDAQPKGTKILANIPSKNGYHIITKPFNVSDFNMQPESKDIEIHKNNPVNLFIP